MINEPYDRPAALTDEDMAKILAEWYECDECVNGQLRRVQELGNSAVVDLANAYDGTAAPNRRTEFEERCLRINKVIEDRGFTPAENCNHYKERYQENLERRYQRRAYRALVAIRTDIACNEIGGINRCADFEPFQPYEVGVVTDRSTRRVD